MKGTAVCIDGWLYFLHLGNGAKRAIISISHDRKYINEVCNRIYRLTDEGLFLQTKGEIGNQ